VKNNKDNFMFIDYDVALHSVQCLDYLII